MITQESPFTFICPRCRSSLERIDSSLFRCPQEGLAFPRKNGIWRFLLPEREAHFQDFIKEYETIRRAEGRGAQDPSFYRALPFEDLSGQFQGDWRIRARSYRVLLKRVLPPMEKEVSQPLKVLDLGAGNGWLSNRLTMHGHHLAAVDLAVNQFDGLGAHRNYHTNFTPVQAEFDRLPFHTDDADLVIFNAAFHYATSYLDTLKESLRVLRRGGQVVIMDTPIYHHPESGEQMVREREAQFEAQFGFPSNALPSENFLTYRRLDSLADKLKLRCSTFTPFYGLRWILRPWIARLRGNREPAKFHIIVGKH